MCVCGGGVKLGRELNSFTAVIFCLLWTVFPPPFGMEAAQHPGEAEELLLFWIL